MTECLQSAESIKGLLDRVRRILRSRYGSVAGAEKALGFPRKTLWSRLSGVLAFRVEELLSLVEQISEDPCDANALLAEVMGIRPDASHSRPDEVLTRFFTVEDGTCPILRNLHTSKATLSVADADLDDADLVRLESQRVNDPKSVADECADFARYNWAPQSMARLLATWAACERSLKNPERAAAILHTAFRLGCPPYSRASIEILQKTTYLLMRVSPVNALLVIDQAHRAAVLTRNEEKIGETLVDRGLVHVAGGDDDRALESYSAALRYLKPQQTRYRRSVHISLALQLSLRKRLPEARAQAQEAYALVPPGEPSFGTASLLWTIALIEYQDGQLCEAERSIRAAIPLLSSAAPIDQLFAQLQLLQIQVELDVSRARVKLANALPSLERTARRSGEAATDLLLSYTSATLTGDIEGAKTALRYLGSESALTQHFLTEN